MCIRDRGIADAGGQHPGGALNGDLSVHYDVVGVLVVEHQLILGAGVVDDGVGEGGGIGGQGGGEADPVFAVGGCHGLVDVHGLAAAHADEGVGNFGQGLDEGDQLVQLLVSGVAGEQMCIRDRS